MRISIVIPAYNSKETLAKCLHRLSVQSYNSSDYEVMVIDDGSTDGTFEMAERMSRELSYRLRCFHQEHKGPAAARNIGIKNAQGEIVMFLGADIMATTNLIEEHAGWHVKYRDGNVAVLGHISWPPDMELTPFLKWLERGMQFGYPFINNHQDASYHFFYSSNLSLKKRFLLDNGLFDEDFPYAAYEDTELGYRLTGKGLKIVYNKKALAYHDHMITPASFRRRSELAGRSLRIFRQKHPETVEKEQPKILLLAKAIIGRFVWMMPQTIARFIPATILNRGYKWMVEDFMRAACCSGL